MLRIAAVLLALVVAASAQAQQPAAAPAKPAAKKSSQQKGAPADPSAAPAASGPCIGVISPIGDAFAVRKGNFLLGDDYSELSGNEFKLHDLVVARVQAAAGRSFVARRIPHAIDTFGPSYNPGGLGLNDAEAAAMVQRAAGSAHCERYVVVAKAGNKVANQITSGVGIINYGALMLNRSEVHALVRVNVHDGRTFAYLKGDRANAARQLDNFDWPESAAAANTPRLRSAAQAMLAEALDRILPALLAP